ncbi:2-C-methyl-D-erythritol 4-phosphate cytidylyltransferase [Oceanispirochaeta sp.]|jgi:2-C-methyl-D-erythritol 4-phosphate cytidylyltransferase|uniref:IspD/TarI family cytidylyltransferase n=1 Tax=Oceanispirochaeta sp. TaxID=2035350 RepID=UPI002631FD39|nr:IspD/TarI family cytidylyltransferase [Oceanispirochaeta sp.]MDA3959116.1 IspD/TarI family cytidylyltransferase [Oceanispirochaeta sp.]
MIKAVIITAAGSSSRMKGKGKKELKLIKGRTVLERAVLPFVLSEQFDHICVTYPEGKKEEMEKALHRINFPISYIQGGDSRQSSVYNALVTLKDLKSDLVLIHDGARPHISEKLIDRVLEGTIQRGNSTPVTGSISAMKILNPLGDIVQHLVRSSTVSAQTPQGFSYPEILEAHEKARIDKKVFIDDSEIWSSYIGPSHTVEGDPENTKITYPEDLKVK